MNMKMKSTAELRDYEVQRPFGKIFVWFGLFTLVSTALIFLFLTRPRENDAPQELLATRIELGDPELRVLQVLGPPACRAISQQTRVWIYGQPEEVRNPCVPEENDLVIFFNPEGLVSGYEPQYGIIAKVGNEMEQALFRQFARQK